MWNPNYALFSVRPSVRLSVCLRHDMLQKDYNKNECEKNAFSLRLL
jgi:hypothetical protein